MAETRTEGALLHAAGECEQTAAALRGIAAAAKKVLDGPLQPNALCLLIREAMPRGTKTSVDTGAIWAVLQGAANLGTHLKPGKG